MPESPQIPGPTRQLLLQEMQLLQHNPLAFLEHVTAAYGDLCCLPLGLFDVIIANHPDAARHVLQDQHKKYSKNTFQYNLLARITGRGLLTSDGPGWFHARRVMQPAFHRRLIHAMAGQMVAAAESTAQAWSDRLQREAVIDVDAEMMQLALRIVGRALFSVDLAADAKDLTGAVLLTLDDLVDRSRNPFQPPAWAPTAKNRRFRAALARLDAAVLSLIQTRREALRRGEAPADLLTALLHAQDPAQEAPLTDQQVRDEIITVLIAGHETVASALTWTWQLLAENPACRQQMTAELDAALGSQPATAADLPNLPFTQAVFDEALRLYPPAWIITRRAEQADELLGFPVRPGTLVVLSPYTLHRHPDYWPQPLAFSPQRFLPENAAVVRRFAYIPFGGGPRLCIGDHFARTEAVIVLATLARRFRLSPADGTAPRIEPLVTLRPHGGLLMRIESRQ